MKRLLFLMAAILILTGCGGETAPTVPPETSAPASAATEPSSGGYAPNSTLEVSTSGSLRVYLPLNADTTGIHPTKEGLLLVSGPEGNRLTLIRDDLPAGEITLDTAARCLQPGDRDITYFDAQNRELVFLSPELAEFRRVSLPDTLVGEPLISGDRKTIYYCDAHSLRSIDLETGIDRLLKEMSHSSQTMTCFHLKETVLQCTVTDEAGQLRTLFLSAETGETLYELEGDARLTTDGSRYTAIYQDGACTVVLTGSKDSEQQQLGYSLDFNQAALAPELDRVIFFSSDIREQTSRLDLVDPVTGMVTASVSIPGTDRIPDFCSDSRNQCLWFRRYDSGYGRNILCRWDYAQNEVSEGSSLLSRRYSLQNPDTEGLAACMETAQALSQRFGVDIRLWTDIPQDDGVSLTAEHQVPLLRRNLAQLEQALSRYPEGFLTQAASATDSGVIRISLVRSVNGLSGDLQYWTDDSACIALSAGEDLERSFHHQLFFILENRVLSNCNSYDNWNSLNPKDFRYTLDEAIPVANAESWLQGPDRAFTEAASMTFPREDRAGIMEYAITEGNAQIFQSEIMQQKLKKLCTGIRKAFDLEKSEERFLWEQYLQ